MNKKELTDEEILDLIETLDEYHVGEFKKRRSETLSDEIKVIRNWINIKVLKQF